MTDMRILSQLLKETALVPIESEYDKPCVKLTEPQAPDSSATIRNLPADAIVIKVDAFQSPDAIFKGENGECKRADYVIISDEKKCILFIEIKRTKDAWDQIVKQLMGAHCFVSYCQEIVKTFWKEVKSVPVDNIRFVDRESEA